MKKRNVTFERHMFRGLQQGPTEKVEQFVLRMRQQAQKCDIRDQLDDNLKDQLIEKCLSAELKAKILDKGDELSLKEAVRLAMTHESIQEQLAAMKTTGNSLSTGGMEMQVNKIQADRQRPMRSKFSGTNRCRLCGRQGHNGGEKCPAKAKACFKCGKTGHFATKCFQKNDGANQQPARHEPPEKRSKDEHVQSVKSVLGEKEKIDYMFCMEADAECNDNEIWAIIGGIRVKAMIDSGSKFNLIDIDSWQLLKQKEIQVKNMRRGSDRIFKAYGGHKLDILGTFEAMVMIGLESSCELFYVMNEKGKLLIGSDTAKKMKLLSIGCSDKVNAIHETDNNSRDPIGKMKPLSRIRNILIELPIDHSIVPIQ